MRIELTRKRMLLWLMASVSFAMVVPLSGAAEGDPAIVKMDGQFIKAAANGEAASVAKFLDKDFTWTDAEGVTLSATEVTHVLPKPALGDESGVDVSERTY